jgi:maltose alpha-D-glucosyltransferase/alpha-amylase
LSKWVDANVDADPLTLDLVDRLLSSRDAIFRRVQAVDAERIDAVKTRYHGDLHLGQVLVAQNDVVIIDFEGEPQRSLEERRRKHTPLRDVAGILRSFDYAAAAAVRAAAQVPAFDVGGFERFCAEWRDFSVKSFMEQYREKVADCPIWPSHPGAAKALSELMIIEKAFYEIGYELANRPAWLSIPVRHMVDLIESPAGEGRDDSDL